MTELIVGLSGHIDHGKTSIIKSLTDEFSGALKEDESRGMTVDLGIAFLNDQITLIDNSSLHAKHKSFDPNKFHLKIIIKSEKLKRMSKIDAHKEIFSILKDEMKTKIHALEIEIN